MHRNGPTVAMSMLKSRNGRPPRKMAASLALALTLAGPALALRSTPSACARAAVQMTAPSSLGGAVRYRARLMYDGEEFTGMQLQPHGGSVANQLEAALAKRAGRRVVVHPAGRTDTGVHARGQAFHFDLLPNVEGPAPDADALQRSLNAMLPKSIRVTAVEEAPELDASGRPWHARLWAAGKLYSYRLCTGDVLDPLHRRQRHHVGRRDLDVGAMAEAARHLHGAIDCAAFANRRAGEPLPVELAPSLTRRTIRRIEVVDEGGGFLRVDFHVQSACVLLAACWHDRSM